MAARPETTPSGRYSTTAVVPEGSLAPGRLLLIRHAETDHNVEQRICGWTDSALSRRGHAQRERLGAHVSVTYRLDRLYASPLQRAWLTAQSIVAQTNLSAEAIDDLREIHFGDLEGLDLAQFEALHPDLFVHWRTGVNLDLHWPGGESRGEFRARVGRAFAPIEAESQTRWVAVVSHGGVIGSYLAGRIGGDYSRWSEFAVRNCSVSEIGWRDGQPILLRHDLVDHLAE